MNLELLCLNHNLQQSQREKRNIKHTSSSQWKNKIKFNELAFNIECTTSSIVARKNLRSFLGMQDNDKYLPDKYITMVSI